MVHWSPPSCAKVCCVPLPNGVNVAFACCAKVCCMHYTMTSLFVVFISAKAM